MDEALWYAGRGTGVVAVLLLTVSVVLGITTRSRTPRLGLPRFGVAQVHRTAGLTATVLMVIHVVTLLFDPYAQLRLFDLVVPWVGIYRPFWLGLGTVALDLMAAIVVTSLLRKRVGERWFRGVHWATYALWPIAVAHGLGTGTDAGTPWFLGLTVLCVGAVAAAVVWRLSEDYAAPARRTSSEDPVTLRVAVPIPSSGRTRGTTPAAECGADSLSSRGPPVPGRAERR